MSFKHNVKGNNNDKIVQVDLHDTLNKNMIRYSLYVLYGRFVPDIRDGLKPVQRRILYAMWNDIHCVSNQTKRKSANTVGAVMGRYHAHGDCLSGGTALFGLDGKINTIGDLYNNGIYSFESLGVNNDTLQVEPILVTNIRIGQYTNKIYHIVLSNGSEIQCTSNHPIMLKDGTYCKAENMYIGMGLFSKKYYINNKNRPCISNNGMIQDIVFNYYNGPVKNGYVKHHIDKNPFNNSFNNLIELSMAEHALIHNDYNKGLEAGRKSMNDPSTFAYINNKLKNQQLMKIYNKDQNFRRFKLYINDLKNKGLEITYENYEKYRPHVYNLPKVETLIKNGYGNSFEELVNNNIPSVGELYSEYKNSLNELCTIVNNKNTPNATYTNEAIYVEDIWVENVDNIPMYDFTVDSTHNMLFPSFSRNDNGYEFSMICMHNSSIYKAMKPMTNWFETKIPLIEYDSNSGSLQGGPQGAMRYTESYISKFSLDYVIGELQESKQVVDWQNTFDNHTVEPESLPVQVPLLLVNGCFAIAIGRKIQIPKHSLSDVIDATINVLHNPKAKVVLIPDPCQKCEVIDTDWKKIANTGFGYYTERGIIEIDSKNNIIHIKSVPDLIYSDTVVEKIEDLIKENKLIGIKDIQDHSTEDQLDIWLLLKNNTDPHYIKQVLYASTPLQEVQRVNMEVIDGLDIKRVSYKAYITYFLEYRRDIKFRLYNAKLQKVETRLHQIETYIKVLESDEVEKIIHMIRNQKSSNIDELIKWLMNKLKITDVQAKFILHTEIRNLSKGNFTKYKEEQKNLKNEENKYIHIITHQELIDEEIENELLEIKAKYGRPRQSILISEAQATDIPEGEFKVIVTEQNYIKKLPIEEPFKPYKGDQAKCVLIGDNSKDILLFDQMGKVFRLPIHKIQFSDRNSAGIDIRLLIKKLTSNIISVMYLSILEELNDQKSKYYLVSVTRKGLIKKINLDDIINANNSGIIYSKLNQGDEIAEVLIANCKSDVVVYTKSKALRISIDSIPHLKRATLGNVSIKSRDPVDGMSVITSKTKDLVVVTQKGKFNRLTAGALLRSERNKAGNSVIKLSKGDCIKKIFSCKNKAKIRVLRPDETLEIDINDIPDGSSISPGKSMCKAGIIKAELIVSE